MNPLRPHSLVSRVEIRAMLSVTRQRVAKIVQHPDFPRPVDVLQDGKLPIWRRGDVERWQAARDEAEAPEPEPTPDPGPEPDPAPRAGLLLGVG